MRTSFGAVLIPAEAAYGTGHGSSHQQTTPRAGIVMEIRTGSLRFPRGRGNWPRVDRTLLNSTQSVRQAIAGLTGTRVGFSSLVTTMSAR